MKSSVSDFATRQGANCSKAVAGRNHVTAESCLQGVKTGLTLTALGYVAYDATN